MRQFVLAGTLVATLVACSSGPSPAAPPSLGANLQPQVSTAVIPYDAAAAIKYARTYYNTCYTDEVGQGSCKDVAVADANPFPNFDSDRTPEYTPGNCANFFSQALMASLVNAKTSNPTPKQVFDNRTRFADKGGSFQWYFNKGASGNSANWISAPKLEAYAKAQTDPKFEGWTFKSLGQVTGEQNGSLLLSGGLKPGDVIFGALVAGKPNEISHTMLVTQVDGCSFTGCTNDRNDDDRVKLTYQSVNRRDESFLRLREALPNAIFRAYRPISFRNGAHVALAMDTTASMGNELNAVATSLSNFIAAKPEEDGTLFSLFTFKDNVSDLGTTADRPTILGQLASLFSSGGDDCPEQSLGAMSQAAQRLIESESSAREIILVTNAESQPGDVNAFLAFAQANQIKVNVLLSGTCGYATSLRLAPLALSPSFPSDQIIPAQELYSALARETGGQYFFLPGGSTADFSRALDTIFAQVGTPLDSEAPVLKISTTPSKLWPANGKLVEIKTTVTVTDNLDPNPAVSFMGISIDEPNDRQLRKRVTSKVSDDDIQITPDGRIFLRAQRSGQATSRVYTLTYKATDAAGNASFATATVDVPHDQR